jgi:DNA-directed RNA polymerase specialized sigma subunit
MALIVEIVEVAEDIFKVKTTQIVDEEENAEWELVQQVEDERSADEFERLEVRDIVRVLLERTELSPREKQVIYLFLQGYDDFAEIAKKLGVSRSRIWHAFKCAIQKLRRTAEALGIAP